jgi:glycosyltransferase involved in cell wall biosynthesis
MPKICFVEAASYPVLNPVHKVPSTGGESVQHTLLAREFAKQGWQVSLVCRDHGQTDGEIIDGIQVWKTYREGSGLKYLRYLYPRIYSMWRGIKNANADVYFQSCAGVMTGLVARYASRHGRKMIFRVAHDTDCIPGQQLIGNNRDRRIYEYGLRAADIISAQSTVQAHALSANYGLNSVVVNMTTEIPMDSTDEPRDIDVLWVNNFRDFKRPELVCEIARSMPNASFTMIGGQFRGFEALFDKVKEEARTIPNLHFVGAVPYDQVNSYFSRAKLFLNTSDSEGFPNSFLQAWVRRVPVVSYFDPDGLIASENLGISVDSQADFVEPLARLLHSDVQRFDMGDRARQFVVDRYWAQSVVDEYEKLMESQLGVGLNCA